MVCHRIRGVSFAGCDSSVGIADLLGLTIVREKRGVRDADGGVGGAQDPAVAGEICSTGLMLPSALPYGLHCLTLFFCGFLIKIGKDYWVQGRVICVAVHVYSES